MSWFIPQTVRDWFNPYQFNESDQFDEFEQSDEGKERRAAFDALVQRYGGQDEDDDSGEDVSIAGFQDLGLDQDQEDVPIVGPQDQEDVPPVRARRTVRFADEQKPKVVPEVDFPLEWFDDLALEQQIPLAVGLCVRGVINSFDGGLLPVKMIISESKSSSGVYTPASIGLEYRNLGGPGVSPMIVFKPWTDEIFMVGNTSIQATPSDIIGQLGCGARVEINQAQLLRVLSRIMADATQCNLGKTKPIFHISVLSDSGEWWGIPRGESETMGNVVPLYARDRPDDEKLIPSNQQWYLLAPNGRIGVIESE